MFSEWFAPFICAGKELEIVSGYADGNFRPGNTLNKAEGMKILVHSLSVPSTLSSTILPHDVKRNEWYAPYVRRAVELNIIPWNERFDPGAGRDRADAGHPATPQKSS